MAVTKRTPRSKAGSKSVDDLKTLVNSLIKENQRLKRQVLRLETKATGSVSATASRALGSIARRLEKALASRGASASRRKSSSSTASKATRRTAAVSRPRKPASPETQAKRLAALAKARAARAEKKAQTG